MAEPASTDLLETLRLAHARFVGPVTYRKLVRVFGSAEAALAAPRARLLEIPDINTRTADGITEAKMIPGRNKKLNAQLSAA